MKIYRKIDYEHVPKNEFVGKNDDGTYDNNQQPNHYHTDTVSETQFVARVMALPLLQEGLSNTQSMASRSKLGRALLDRTHTMIQRISHTIHQAQETPTYQHYFQQGSYLQRSLMNVDTWACSSLDIIESRIPLLHQPGTTFMDTLLLKQPRQQLKSRWDSVITQSWQKFNGNINHKLDQAEHWIKSKNRMDDTDGNDGRQETSLHQRLILLGGTAFWTGWDRSTMVVKEQCAEWSQPLYLQECNITPLATLLKSRLGASLPNWNLGTHLTTKTESVH